MVANVPEDMAGLRLSGLSTHGGLEEMLHTHIFPWELARMLSWGEFSLAVAQQPQNSSCLHSLQSTGVIRRST